MSDDFLRLYVKDVSFIPEEHAVNNALVYLKELAPKADSIDFTSDPAVAMIDCGADLESVSCPHCGAELDMQHWHEWMEADYKAGTFMLAPIAMRCCGKKAALNDLTYREHIGFAKVWIDIMNPRIEAVSAEVLDIVSRILGSEVSMVRSHL